MSNYSFSTDLNSFAHCCPFMDFALLKQLALRGHRLKYPWGNLLLAHVARPIVIVDFNLLDTNTTARQNFRNLNFFMIISIR